MSPSTMPRPSRSWQVPSPGNLPIEAPSRSSGAGRTADGAPKGVAGADGVSYRPRSLVRHVAPGWPDAPPVTSSPATTPGASGLVQRGCAISITLYTISTVAGRAPGCADDGWAGRAIGDVRRRMVPWCAVLAGRAWLGCPAPARGRQACAPDFPATSRACASAAGFGMVTVRRSATRCPTPRTRCRRLSRPILAACRSHARP